MALNSEYFDSINIDVVKKKYYNANKVNALLADIRGQAVAMYEENLAMRSQLDSINGQKSEIGDAVLSAQRIYREIIEKAEMRAAEILEDAEEKAADMLNDAEYRSSELSATAKRQQEHAVSHAQKLFDTMRSQQEAVLEQLNTQWQSFLCGLYTEDELEAGDEEAAEPVIPDDLDEKLSLIARELQAITEEE